MRARLGIGAGFLTALLLLSQQPPGILNLLTAIPLPEVRGRIDHLAADLRNGRLFVAALGNGTVEVIDIKKNLRAGTVSGLAEPQGLVYLNKTNRLLVATGGDGSVQMFDGRTFKLLRSSKLGADADNVRLDAATGQIFVGYGDGALAILDGSGKQTGVVALSAHPEAFQLETAGHRIFVNVPGARQVVVLDRERKTVIAKWPIPGAFQNFPLALDEANRRVFVVTRLPARLLVFDMDSGALKARLGAPGDCDDISYDPIHSRLYASGGEGSLVVYQQQDADRYQEIRRQGTVSGARTSLFVPEWNRLFVAVRERGSQHAEIRIYEPR